MERIPVTELTLAQRRAGWFKFLRQDVSDDRIRHAWSEANQCALEDAGDGTLLYVSFRHHKIVHFPTLSRRLAAA